MTSDVPRRTSWRALNSRCRKTGHWARTTAWIDEPTVLLPLNGMRSTKVRDENLDFFPHIIRRYEIPVSLVIGKDVETVADVEGGKYGLISRRETIVAVSNEIGGKFADAIADSLLILRAVIDASDVLPFVGVCHLYFVDVGVAVLGINETLVVLATEEVFLFVIQLEHLLTAATICSTFLDRTCVCRKDLFSAFNTDGVSVKRANAARNL